MNNGSQEHIVMGTSEFIRQLQPYINSIFSEIEQSIPITITSNSQGLVPTPVVQRDLVQICPGLNRVKNHKWYVPHGCMTTNITYCKYCVDNMKITGCTLADLKSNSCNCDSFLLRKQSGNEILTISIWDDTLKHNYLPDDNGIVRLPNGVKFAIFINSVADNQYFSFKLKVGDDIILMPHKDLLFKRSALCRHNIDGHSFMFAENCVDSGISDSSWETIKSFASTEIQVEVMFHTLEDINIDHISNENIGSFIMNDKGEVSCLSTDDSTKIIVDFNHDYKKDFLHFPPGFKNVQLFHKPQVFTIKLGSDDSIIDIGKIQSFYDKASKRIIAKNKSQAKIIQDKITSLTQTIDKDRQLIISLDNERNSLLNQIDKLQP